MSRLQTQLHRLYHPQPGAATGSLTSADLVNARNETRTLVLELARPADWDTVAHVWEGVQKDLDLPAPAIAVNGQDGYQLWFSTVKPLSLAQAHAVLQALQARYWSDIPPKRIRAWPAMDATHATLVPTLLDDTGQWSAFVTRDLAPVFTDSPWLDIPPNPEGQADLLTPLRAMEASALQAAMTLLADMPRPASPPSTIRQPGPHLHTPDADASAPEQDPRRFLLRVMNDPSVDMALRIEAAKALLPAP